MAYRIDYENGAIKTEIRVKQSGLKRILSFVCLVALLVGIAYAGWYRLRIRDLILPGNADLTQAAIDNMVNNLRSGQGAGEAITAFCREIIYGTAP